MIQYSLAERLLGVRPYARNVGSRTDDSPMMWRCWDDLVLWWSCRGRVGCRPLRVLEAQDICSGSSCAFSQTHVYTEAQSKDGSRGEGHIYEAGQRPVSETTAVLEHRAFLESQREKKQESPSLETVQGPGPITPWFGTSSSRTTKNAFNSPKMPNSCTL